MKSSENLFYLVKSLTKAEKRYFNISFLQNSGNKNYSKLFVEIERQARGSIYDEPYIKTKFKNEKFVKQLTFTKNYLYNLIIKSLINFYSGGNLEAKIYSLIISAKILFRKDLYNDYFKNLETAKILAEKSERFGILTDILKLQMKLVRLKDRKKYKKRNLYDEEAAVIEKIENITAYSKLLNAFYRITKIPDHARSKILYKETQRIFENPLLNSEKNALSITALDMYLTIATYKNEFYENTSKLFETAIKKYEVYKKNNIVFSTDLENKDIYLAYNALYCAILNGKWNYYKSNLKTFKEKLTRAAVRNNIIDVLINYDFLQAQFSYRKNNLKEAVVFAGKIFEHMRKNEAVQNKDDLLSFYFFYAKILFEYKNYFSALDVVNIIVNHEYKDVRYDILSYSYFLEMFIHYELKNYQLVGSYIRALSRKLSKHKEKDLSEKIILKFFSELCSETRIDESFVLKKYLKKFQTLKKDKFEKAFFNELPIDKWIEKKIS